MHVTILGAGVYGEALATVLDQNHHTVSFFDPRKYPEISLVRSARSADAVVIAVPSAALPELLAAYPKSLMALPTVLATKGLVDLALFEEFADLSALSGPAFAVDLGDRVPTTLTATGEIARTLFQTAWLTIELTADLPGLLLCGTLKNIYAIGSGLLGLEPDTPTFASYIETSHLEIKQILAVVGADPATADLSCGIGDLILTCGSTRSRNYQFGRALAADPDHAPDQTTEGFSALCALPADFPRPPMLRAVYRAIIQHRPLDLARFMAAVPIAESGHPGRGPE